MKVGKERQVLCLTLYEINTAKNFSLNTGVSVHINAKNQTLFIVKSCSYRW